MAALTSRALRSAAQTLRAASTHALSADSCPAQRASAHGQREAFPLRLECRRVVSSIAAISSALIRLSAALLSHLPSTPARRTASLRALRRNPLRARLQHHSRDKGEHTLNPLHSNVPVSSRRARTPHTRHIYKVHATMYAAAPAAARHYTHGGRPRGDDAALCSARSSSNRGCAPAARSAPSPACRSPQLAAALCLASSTLTLDGWLAGVRGVLRGLAAPLDRGARRPAVSSDAPSSLCTRARHCRMRRSCRTQGTATRMRSSNCKTLGAA